MVQRRFLSFVFLVPASAIIIGNIFLDEKIEFTTIIGVIFSNDCNIYFK